MVQPWYIWFSILIVSYRASWRHIRIRRGSVVRAGPMGSEMGDQEQWKFPRVTLTQREKRLIVATVMRIAVLTLFRTHNYTIGRRAYSAKVNLCDRPPGDDLVG